MFNKGWLTNKKSFKDRIRAASGRMSADLVIKDVHFLDVFSGEFVRGDVAVSDNVIVGVKDNYSGDKEIDGRGLFLVPGFIDAHVHIESSLMTPESFERAVLPCGTTTVIWDPHEISNVLGKAGIEWAIASTKNLFLDVFIMVPSCVPATPKELGLETSGASLAAADIKKYLNEERVLGLAEMMNFPGLLMEDEDILEKLFMFLEKNRDGHCPGLTGKDLNAYSVTGIHSCHEATTLDEAREKLLKGIFPLIREGSCAKDADALLPILNSYTSGSVAFCSDDRNPADISREGHINHIVTKALMAGLSPQDVFRAASFGAARIFGLEDRGVLAPGYIADFCLVSPQQEKNWQTGCQIHAVYKKGRLIEDVIFGKGPKAKSFAGSHLEKKKKNLNIFPCQADKFKIKTLAKESVNVRVIGVRPGQIITDFLTEPMDVTGNEITIDIKRDILKIAVLERHHGTGRGSVGFVRGFELKEGAIATSIGHDCHNVLVVGASETAMIEAVNRLIEIDGGIVVMPSESSKKQELQLPLGGLMTNIEPSIVTEGLYRLKKLARELGCDLEEPFLQLSFLALPVIPNLKITDKGLVDVNEFKLISLIEE